MYKNFAAAYGTILLVLLLLSLLTQSSIQTGVFGLFGFPIISFLYALIATDKEKKSDLNNQALEKKLAEIDKKLIELRRFEESSLEKKLRSNPFNL